MKGWIFVPVALVLGLVLGGWAPRQEAHRLKNELELARTSAPRGNMGAAALGALSQIIPVATPAEPKVTPETKSETPPVEGGKGAGPETQAPEPENRWDKESIRQQIDLAMEAWRMRSELVRNTFVANNALNAAEAAQFDTLIAAMNLRLKNEIQKYADQLAAGETMSEESGLRMMNQLSSHVLQAYADMDKSMPASWRAASGEEFSMADLIDPMVAEPLVGLEDRIQAPRHRRHWGNRP